MQETFEDKDIEKLAQMMAREFNRVEERFDAIDRRFETVDKRFDDVDHRLEQLEDGQRHIRNNVLNLYNEDFITRAEFDDTQGRVSYMERKLGIVSGK